LGYDAEMIRNRGAILITGVHGLIGRAVARSLAGQGRIVFGTDQTADADPAYGYMVLAADLADKSRLLRLMEVHQIIDVIHCGAVSGPMLARDDPFAICQTNIVGTVNVLECARVLGVRRVVFCSSCGAYGATGSGPVKEDAPFAATDIYGVTKASGDMLVRAYGVQYNFDGICLRISWVYGPRRMTHCVIRAMLTDALIGRQTKLAYGTGFYRQFVFIDDVVDAIVAALDVEKVLQSAYNITGGNRLTLDEVAAVVRAIVPAAKIELGAGPDPHDYHQELFDIAAANHHLGWSPRHDIRQGIEAYAEWLVAEQEAKRAPS
jgi:UDP-glucuronate 4-epimerase